MAFEEYAGWCTWARCAVARVLIVDEHAQGRHFPVRGVIDTARIYLNRSR